MKLGQKTHRKSVPARDRGRHGFFQKEQSSLLRFLRVAHGLIKGWAGMVVGSHKASLVGQFVGQLLTISHIFHGVYRPCNLTPE